MKVRAAHQRNTPLIMRGIKRFYTFSSMAGWSAGGVSTGDLSDYSMPLSVSPST